MRNLAPEETLTVLARILSTAAGAPQVPLRNTNLHGVINMELGLQRVSGYPGNRNTNVTWAYWLNDFKDAGIVEAFLVYEQAEQAVVHAELRRALGLAEVPEMLELILAEVAAYFRLGELVAEQAAMLFPVPVNEAPEEDFFFEDEEDRAEMLGRRVQPIPIQEN